MIEIVDHEVKLSCIPSDKECGWCGEPVTPDNFYLDILHSTSGIYIPYHRECLVRAYRGSVLHQERQCRCFGSDYLDTHPDPETSMTRREAAVYTFRYFNSSTIIDVQVVDVQILQES